MSWFLPVLLLASALPQTAAPGPASTDTALFQDAARTAWSQFNRLYRRSTGLAYATPGYNKLTSWDIGSVLAALFSARQLELISEQEYRQRLSRTLKTLETIPLFQKTAFHRMYLADRAQMAARTGGLSTRGYGWSATDLGRLLVWLRIIAQNEPGFAKQAERVARRLNYDRIVADGYLFGEEVTRERKTRRFQEGRIGYEQYAAQGFALWGARVENALDVRKNARPFQLLGVELLADTRSLDRLLSEPFVLMGLELGWPADYGTLARNVLAVQEARSRETNTVTIASEDAIALKPHYFYYYCVYCNGKAFVIDVADPGKTLTEPRWVSTKATFGWHALLPSAYTQRAIAVVAKARTKAGWSSGVFEKSQRPTGSYDINTAAVILEAAAYAKLGRPLMRARQH